MATGFTNPTTGEFAAADPFALPYPSAWSFAELQAHLGIPLERIRVAPPPGTATEDDVTLAHDRDGLLCELIDGVLVEKAVGRYESKVAVWVIHYITNYLCTHDIGEAYAPDGPMRVLPKQVRMPDVAFVRKERVAAAQPIGAILPIAPDLAIEVLSASNTPREMRRKLLDYFAGGTKLVWYIDPTTRSAMVYTSPTEETAIPADGVLDGGDVLPGFQLSLAELFQRVGDK